MPQWIDLDGVANMRDVGGIRTADGRHIQPGRLLRSDNLQDLTAADIAELRRRGVSDVIDLRTAVEKDAEGPTPLQAEGGINHHHFSFFIEQDDDGDGTPDSLVTSAPGDGPEPVTARHFSPADIDDDDEEEEPAGTEQAATKALPWVDAVPSVEHETPVVAHYLSYVADRPDSVLGALRAIAYAPGASIVHCAAGKDRTGTTVALALLVADADPAEIVADYAASSERMEGIVDRLMSSQTYRKTLEGRTMSSHLARPETMQAVLDHVHHDQGGVIALLTKLGWTAEDTAALRSKLLDA